ncbi:hypothetical protein YC2023_044877 [Brassica napus]
MTTSSCSTKQNNVRCDKKDPWNQTQVGWSNSKVFYQWATGTFNLFDDRDDHVVPNVDDAQSLTPSSSFASEE